MNDLEALFGKRVLWLYSRGINKYKFTEDEFNTLKACEKYQLQVEAGEVNSNIKKLNKNYIIFSIIWIILASLNIRSSYIIGKEPSVFVLKGGMPVIVVGFLLGFVFLTTLYSICQAYMYTRIAYRITTRRKKAKKKLELLETEVYSEDKLPLDYKYLSLIAIDIKIYTKSFMSKIKSDGTEEIDRVLNIGGKQNEKE